MMATLVYDANADVYYSKTANDYGDKSQSTNVPEDDEIERDLHKRYPLLALKRIDGWNDAQIARGQGISVTVLRERMNIERIRASHDPACQIGPGRALWS